MLLEKISVGKGVWFQIAGKAQRQCGMWFRPEEKN